MNKWKINQINIKNKTKIIIKNYLKIIYKLFINLIQINKQTIFNSILKDKINNINLNENQIKIKK
jgi:hypothetical protein